MVESSEITNDTLRCLPPGITLRRHPPGIRCRLFAGSPESRVPIHSSKSVDGMGPSMPSEAAARRSVGGPDARLQLVAGRQHQAVHLVVPGAISQRRIEVVVNVAALAIDVL